MITRTGSVTGEQAAHVLPMVSSRRHQPRDRPRAVHLQFDIAGADPRGGSGVGPGILQYPLWLSRGWRSIVARPGHSRAMWMRRRLRETPKIQDLETRCFPMGATRSGPSSAPNGDRTVGHCCGRPPTPKRFRRSCAAARQRRHAERRLASRHHGLDDRGADDRPTIQRGLACGRSTAVGASTSVRGSPGRRQVAFFERDRFDRSVSGRHADGRIEQTRRQRPSHFDSLRSELRGRLEPDAADRSDRCAAAARCWLIVPGTEQSSRDRDAGARRYHQPDVLARRPIGF